MEAEKIKIDNGQLTAEASIDLDRTRRDIRYGSGKFLKNLGDNLIDDYIHFKVKLVSQAAN